MALLTLTSITQGIYPEPVWYEMDFNDGVIHKWHRSVLYDAELFENVKNQVNLKYNNKTIERINYESSYLNYKLNRIKIKEKMYEILNDF